MLGPSLLGSNQSPIALTLWKNSNKVKLFLSGK